jgi:high affinity Mn2+ porin
MHPQGESKTSEVFTLYTGLEATRTTELVFDLESAGGRGISDALGLAGFTNLDVVRNPELGRTPYIARAYIRQIVPLSKEKTKVQRGIFNVFQELPAKRLEFRFGKFGMADFFDLNSIGTDSHLQFLNWTVDNNGGYDYAANTRGYTFGMMAELVMPSWSLRFCEALMPTVANGIDLDFHLPRARSENVEFELRKSLIAKRNGALRLLSYVNHANMGVYREANAAFLAGIDPAPDITAHRQQGNVKYGFGINAEQELTGLLRVFGRFGWNEGQHESFAYTEVNQSFLFGGDLKGDRWHRKQDKIGLAFVTNGLSRDHQLYLKLGGSGFLLGDANLNYGRENIVEGYYNAHVWRGLFVGFDLQHVNNPGYNRDRGPVLVPAVRLHVDL